jgi:hypothetical protein
MRQKPIELVQKMAHDPMLIANWFSRFNALREEFRVIINDIWNFNETGFQISVRRGQWIIIASTLKRSYLATDGA